MITKYIEPNQLFGDRYLVKKDHGTSDQIVKSAKVFISYENALKYDKEINEDKIIFEERSNNADNLEKEAEKAYQEVEVDINSFAEKTKSGIQEEIKRVKDSFKHMDVDLLEKYHKWLEEQIRTEKEAETNEILDHADIIYFDTQPFLKESDLVKNEENKEKKPIKYDEISEKSSVNHPEHYQNEGGLETIEEMILLFGFDETMSFCKLNAWKYRARASKKGNLEEDLKKANWYILKYQELRKRKLEYDLHNDSQ